MPHKNVLPVNFRDAPEYCVSDFLAIRSRSALAISVWTFGFTCGGAIGPRLGDLPLGGVRPSLPYSKSAYCFGCPTSTKVKLSGFM